MLFSFLKFRPVTLLASLLLVIALPFFFVGGPDLYSTALFRAIWDCGHILFFAGLVVALHTAVDFSKVRAGIILTLMVFVGGGMIELIQANTGRDGSWQDLLRNLAGTWMGLFWVQKASYQVWLGRILASLLLLPSLLPIYSAAQTQRHAEQQFPLLADFETDLDFPRVAENIERSTAFHSAGKYSLKVRLTTEEYTGVSFENFFNSWQGYDSLLFDIYNPNVQPVAMTIRIDDKLHKIANYVFSDRFNQKLHLQPGWNAIKIPIAEIQRAPATRLLKLDAIKSMVIFATNQSQEQDIYLDNLRLQ